MVNEYVLAQIFDCRTADLVMLNEVRYDLRELIDELIKDGYYPDLNAILGAIFSKGFEELSDIVYEKMNSAENDYDTCADELKETADMVLDELESLQPNKDIWWQCNCLDSYICFLNNENLYRKYFQEEIENIEDKMGFSFGE